MLKFQPIRKAAIPDGSRKRSKGALRSKLDSQAFVLTEFPT